MEASSPWYVQLGYAVAAGFTFAVLNYVGNLYQRRRVHEAAAGGAKAGAEEAVKPVAETVNKVEGLVNGGGLTAAVGRVETGVADIKAEMRAHTEDDKRQFAEMRKALYGRGD